MSDLVELVHPTLPDQPIFIPEPGVWHRERAGWRRTGPPELATDDDDPADADAPVDLTKKEH